LRSFLLVLEKVREGKIDPYDVDVLYLVELFRKTANGLGNSEYMREAGRFLEASAKLIRLQAENIFPEAGCKKTRNKITIREVKKILIENENGNDYTPDFLWNYSPGIGRPAGRKNAKSVGERERKIKADNIPLLKEKNYSELAKEVRIKIQKGEFKVKTITDFIAYLFAYYEYDDVPELFKIS